MPIAGSAAIPNKIQTGFVHLGENLVSVEMMLKPVFEAVSFLDRLGAMEFPHRGSDSGLPDTTSSFETFGERNHDRGSRLQKGATIPQKSDSAVSSWNVHIAGEANQNRVVLAAAQWNRRRRRALQRRGDAAFPQRSPACFDQGFAAVEPFHAKAGARECDHLPPGAG